MIAIILLSTLTSALPGPNDSPCIVFDASAQRAECETRAHVQKLKSGMSLYDAEFRMASIMMAEPAIAAINKMPDNPDTVMRAIGHEIGQAIVQRELTEHPYSAYSLEYKAKRTTARLWARAKAIKSELIAGPSIK